MVSSLTKVEIATGLVHFPSIFPHNGQTKWHVTIAKRIVGHPKWTLNPALTIHHLWSFFVKKNWRWWPLPKIYHIYRDNLVNIKFGRLISRKNWWILSLAIYWSRVCRRRKGSEGGSTLIHLNKIMLGMLVVLYLTPCDCLVACHLTVLYCCFFNPFTGSLRLQRLMRCKTRWLIMMMIVCHGIGKWGFTRDSPW